MKLQILSAALLLSLSQLSFASSEPASCPTVTALQSVGVNVVVKDQGKWVGFVQADNFSTNEKWSFVFGKFKAKNEDDAKSQANKAISTLNLDKGPMPFEIEGKPGWTCSYKDNSGHKAATFTPPLEAFKSLI